MIERKTPQQRPDAGGKLLEMEGLRQIVVRAGIQADHLVLYRPLGRKNKHRGLHAPRPEFAQQGDAVPPGKHQVENNPFVFPFQGHLQPAFTVVGAHHIVLLFLQPLFDKVGHFLFIFNNENRHISCPNRFVIDRDKAMKYLSSLRSQSAGTGEFVWRRGRPVISYSIFLRYLLPPPQETSPQRSGVLSPRELYRNQQNTKSRLLLLHQLKEQINKISLQ